MEEEVPLIVRLSREHDFEMDERNYLIQSDSCLIETTTKKWKKCFLSALKFCGYFKFLILFFNILKHVLFK